MSQYSILDEFEQGMACISDAQDLLKADASREQIMERLDHAIDALGFFIGEITKGEPQ
jgi:hypothetical protein